MTNKNAAANDGKSGFDIFSVALRKSMFSRSRKLNKKIEGVGSGGAKVSAWIDSMRDSSPTRVKSAGSFSESDEINSWMVTTVNYLFIKISIVNFFFSL